jgi:chemotaxis protein CheC
MTLRRLLSMEQLTEIEKEALMKIANLGAANAASALSMIVQKPVTITIPRLDIVPVTRIFELVEGEEEVVGTYSRLSRGIDAMMMIMFKGVQAGDMVDILLGEAVGTVENIEEMALSTLQEVGNIMISAFSNALADFLGIKVVPSPPAVGVDMAGALLDSIIIEMGRDTDTTFFFNTDFLIHPGALMGHLFLSLSPESMGKFLEKLK